MMPPAMLYLRTGDIALPDLADFFPLPFPFPPPLRFDLAPGFDFGRGATGYTDGDFRELYGGILDVTDAGSRRHPTC